MSTVISSKKLTLTNDVLFVIHVIFNYYNYIITNLMKYVERDYTNLYV